MISKNLIQYAQKRREILQKHRAVDCKGAKAHSRLYRPYDEPDEIDICVDENGSKIIEELKEKFFQYRDPYYNERLLNLWGRSYIEGQIYSFIRKKKFIRNIPRDLVYPKRHRWNVLVGLTNVEIKKKVDFKIAILHPKAMGNDRRISKKLRSTLWGLDQNYFIEIRDVEAPTVFYAGIKAIERARSCLSLIPNRHSSLSHREDIRFSGHVVGYNKTMKKWFPEWHIPHKGLLISEYEQNVLNDLGKVIKKALRRKSGLSVRIQSIMEMLFASKATQYPPAKLLLLATVLESLLLEETFNQTLDYKKINRRADRINQPNMKVKKGRYFHARLDRIVNKFFNLKNPSTRKALNFLSELYDQRSEVTHLCHKHGLQDQQVQIIENMCLVLLKKLCASKARTHLAALRDIGAIVGGSV